jgi:DNA modification methylase
VLDSFAGAGTTGIAARQLQRKFIGIELIESFCQIAQRRLLADAPGAGRG